MRQDQSSIKASFLKKSSESWPFVVRAVRCAYFFEFGLTVKGPLGFQLLAKKYSIPSKSVIERWVTAYKAYGKDGLQRKSKNEVYSVQFKVDVLHFMKKTGASYQDTAIQFKMNNPSLIANWNSIFQKQGIEGLLEKVKGAPVYG